MEERVGSKRLREDDEERSSDGSDEGSDMESFIASDDDDASTKPDEDDTLEAVPEVTGTVVGGRVLRNRGAMKPVERYFDTETYKRLMEQDEARDMLVLLRKWNESGEYKSALTKRTPYDVVVREYRAAKAAMQIPDTDTESTDEEEEEDQQSNKKPRLEEGEAVEKGKVAEEDEDSEPSSDEEDN